jgi:membrane-associated phospholipid phosphatase
MPARPGEWVQIGYFTYVTVVALAMLPREYALLSAGYAWGVWLVFRRVTRGIARDWLALFFTLLAYRQMDWFTPERRTHALENAWIVWDRVLLHDWGLQRAVEIAGAAVPSLLECAYLVVYAAGPFCIAVLYVHGRFDRTWIVLLYYALGTMLAYGCFPYFPSEPPRVVFPGEDLPNIVTWVRRSNLAVLGGAGIHSSVFPSAHVSSAFSLALGMRAALPEKRWIGVCVAVYATLVAIATVYGRYHYAIDVVAGAGVALAAAGFAGRVVKRHGSRLHMAS